MRKRGVPDSSEPREDAQNVPKFSPALEATVGKLADIRRKPKAQQIQKIDLSLGVPKPYQIARAAPTFPESLNRMFDAA
jgi:hypothetical protein